MNCFTKHNDDISPMFFSRFSRVWDHFRYFLEEFLMV